MILRELALTDEDSFEEMLKAWDGNLAVNLLYGVAPGMDFPWLIKVLSQAPETSLYGFLGKEIVGKVSLRQDLENAQGHIGFSVLPHHRGKGYATQMLSLAVEYLKNRGHEKILITCEEKNIASSKVIENSGGRLEEIRDGIKHYWIET